MKKADDQQLSRHCACSNQGCLSEVDQKNPYRINKFLIGPLKKFARNGKPVTLPLERTTWKLKLKLSET